LDAAWLLVGWPGRVSARDTRVVIGYDDVGDRDAESIVLLPGAGLPRQMWQPQLASLSVRYRVVVADLPGLDPDEDIPFTVSGAATAIADLVRTRVGGPVHVCGLSLGAIVATQMALDAADVVRSLVLSGGQVRPPRLLMALQRLIVGALPANRLVSVSSSIRARYPDVAAAALTQQMRVGKTGILHMLREASKVDFRSRLAEITAPTLVLCGARDRANLPAARALAARVRHAELRVVPGAGHVWNLEHPDLFTQSVVRWVDRHRPAGSAGD
jgi:3-oxoadipate enol-lactonase